MMMMGTAARCEGDNHVSTSRDGDNGASTVSERISHRPGYRVLEDVYAPSSPERKTRHHSSALSPLPHRRLGR